MTSTVDVILGVLTAEHPEVATRDLARTIAVAVDEHRCPVCGDVGWTLNDQHAGAGNDTGPVTLDLGYCYYPTCAAARPPRPIATLGVLGMFADVVRHPANGTITALTGFTEPATR